MSASYYPCFYFVCAFFLFAARYWLTPFHLTADCFAPHPTHPELRCDTDSSDIKSMLRGGDKRLDTGSDVVWFRQKNPKGRRFRSWIDAVHSQLKVHMRETTSRSSAAFLPRKLNITKPSSVTETSVDKVRQCVDRTGDTSVSPFFKK